MHAGFERKGTGLPGLVYGLPHAGEGVSSENYTSRISGHWTGAIYTGH
jgi:hypothetical protein